MKTNKKKKKWEPPVRVSAISAFGITNEELCGKFFEEDEVTILDSHDNGYETENDADDADVFENTLFLFEYQGSYGVVLMPGWSEYDWDRDLDFQRFETKEEAEKMFELMKTDGIRPFGERIILCKEAVGRRDFYIKKKCCIYRPSYQIFSDRNLLLDNVPLDPDLIRETLERYDKLKEWLGEHGCQIEDISKDRKWNDNQRYFEFWLMSEEEGGIHFREHIPSKIQGRPRCSLDFLPMDELYVILGTGRGEEYEAKRARYLEKKENEAQEIIRYEKERDEYLVNHRILTRKDYRSLCHFIGTHDCDGTLLGAAEFSHPKPLRISHSGTAPKSHFRSYRKSHCVFRRLD